MAQSAGRFDLRDRRVGLRRNTQYRNLAVPGRCTVCAPCQQPASGVVDGTPLVRPSRGDARRHHQRHLQRPYSRTAGPASGGRKGSGVAADAALYPVGPDAGEDRPDQCVDAHRRGPCGYRGRLHRCGRRRDAGAGLDGRSAVVAAAPRPGFSVDDAGLPVLERAGTGLLRPDDFSATDVVRAVQSVQHSLDGHHLVRRHPGQ